MMEKRTSHSGTRLAGLVVCLAMIASAGVASYFKPSTVTTLRRVNGDRVDGELRHYMLFFILIGEDRVSEIQDVQLHHASRSDATLEIKTAAENIRLHTTFFLREQAIRKFLTDSSKSDFSFRTTPHLFFVAIVGGLGALFLAIGVSDLLASPWKSVKDRERSARGERR